MAAVGERVQRVGLAIVVAEVLRGEARNTVNLVAAAVVAAGAMRAAAAVLDGTFARGEDACASGGRSSLRGSYSQELDRW